MRARALSDGTTVVLEGSASPETADQARHVASAMAKGVTVVDYFQAASTSLRQVMVRSRVIDIDRIKTRELGLDWGPVQNVLGAGGIVTKIVGDQPFSFGEARNGPLKLDQGGPLSRFDPIGFKLHALENQNAARVLSEPNIVVLEGHKAGILVGGEIPIPVAQQSGTGSRHQHHGGVQAVRHPVGRRGDGDRRRRDDDAAGFARGERAGLHECGDGQRLQPAGAADPPHGHGDQDPERPDAGDRRPAAERHHQERESDPASLQDPGARRVVQEHPVPEGGERAGHPGHARAARRGQFGLDPDPGCQDDPAGPERQGARRRQLGVRRGQLESAKSKAFAGVFTDPTAQRPTA